MGKKEEWERYAEGTVTTKIRNQESRFVSLDEIREKCPNRLTDLSEEESRKVADGNHFGMRYQTMKREITFGKSEALQKIVLSPRFKDDLKQMYFHPFMLDVAMAPIDSNALKNFFIPVSYKSFVLYEDLPDVFYSHSVYDMAEDKSEVIKFNVELLDDSGKVIGDIKNYIVKKIEKKQKQYLYELTWKSVSMSEPVKNDNSPIVIIGEDKNYISKLRLMLTGRGMDVCTLACDEIQADYDGMWEQFEKFASIKIIDCFGMGKKFGFEVAEYEKLERMITHLKKLVSSLVFTDDRKEVELILLSNHAYKINETDTKVNPIVAAYVNYAKVVHQEYRSIKCRSIDIDEFTDGSVVCDEVLCSNDLYAVAYREQQRYQEQLGLASGAEDNNTSAIVDNGVYVITGGYGGIGLATAKALSKNNKIVLVLIGRNPIDANDSEKNSIIEELAENTIELKHYNIDIANTKEVQHVFEEIRTIYGKINGVIHCAGIAGGCYILEESEKDFYEVAKAKTIGLWNIHNATQKDNLDFMILQSSINTLLPNYGQASYIAANAFMDAAAQLRNDMGMKTISIKWSAWNVGMAARNEQKESVFYTWEQSEAADLFTKILTSNAAVIVMGVLNKTFLSHAEITLPFLVDQHILEFLNKKTIKTDLNNVIKMTDDVETNLYQIWENFFGTGVDKNKSYYDLGGDSILATQLLKEIDSLYPNLIDIGDIFIYKTYNQLSNYIKEKVSDKKGNNKKEESKMEDTLDSILDRLQRGELSPEEAAML
ncbi:MAG: SDR family NAD(P)-dependent oxidoreductase [Eubacterium sp.]|nr:SDR family NAD(P)-dependent oxidoreductase [Eubacterium sp.]